LERDAFVHGDGVVGERWYVHRLELRGHACVRRRLDERTAFDDRVDDIARRRKRDGDARGAGGSLGRAAARRALTVVFELLARRVLVEFDLLYGLARRFLGGRGAAGERRGRFLDRGRRRRIGGRLGLLDGRFRLSRFASRLRRIVR